MADIHKSGLVTSLNDVFGSAKYSDLTIKCGADEYKLHRVIVCQRSAFFAAACDGQFKVHDLSMQYLARRITVITLLFQEAKTSIVALGEDDPPTVRRMLTYLYTLTYHDEGDAASAQHYMVNGTKVVNFQAQTTMTTPLSEEEQLRHAKMMNNVVVYAIAQKYHIGELKELATAKLRELLWLEAPSHGLPDIIDAIFETTASTDPGLRKVAVEFCTHYSTEIVADDYLYSIIKDHGELGLDVLRGVNEKNCQQKGKLKRELAQMMSDASNIEMAPAKSIYQHVYDHARVSMAELQHDLEMAHDSIPTKN